MDELPTERILDGMLMKHIPNNNPHRRHVWISEDQKRLCWSAPEDEKPNATQKSIELRSVVAVRPGKLTPLFQKRRAKDIPDNLCFSVLTRTRFVDFHTQNEDERDHWVGVIQACVQAQKCEMEDESKRARTKQREATKSTLLGVWEKRILSNEDLPKMTPEIRKLWMQGLPPKFRGILWANRVGNDLCITPDLYAILLQRSRAENAPPSPEPPEHSQPTTENSPTFQQQHSPNNSSLLLTPSRSERADSLSSVGSDHSFYSPAISPLANLNFSNLTDMQAVAHDIQITFPELHVFQIGGPFHSHIVDLFLAHSALRPDVSYVRGHTAIAAIFLMNMEPLPAFICYANLVNRSFFSPFLVADTVEINRRLVFLWTCIGERLPELTQRFKETQLELLPFVRDWFQCLFATALPLDISCHVIDCYLCEGESFLFRFVVGLLAFLEPRLICKSKEDCVHILTNLTDEEIDEDSLFDVVSSVVLPKKS